MISPLAVCNFGPSSYLLFGPNVGPLQYYSHLPIIVVSVVLAGFILIRNWRELPNQILFSTISIFVLWVFFDSIIWATNRADLIMFMWSLQVLIEPLVYIGCLYLLYSLFEKRDISFWIKLLWAILYLPLIVFVPTEYVLSSFDLTNCLAVETIYSYYSYLIEIPLFLWIIVYSTVKFHYANAEDKKQIAYLAAGVVLLLAAFSWGNIIGSFTDDWQLAQYGLFGMPIFTGFLVYSIVKYRTFNIKLLGSVALVLVLCALTFSLLFVEKVQVFRGVGFATFVLALVFGLLLIRGVNREVQQRERIQKLAEELERYNEQLSEFMSLATHEIRNPATFIKGFTAGALEGDLGELSPTIKDGMQKLYIRANDIIHLGNQYLNKSKLELNQLNFEFVPLDMRKLVEDLVHEFEPAAQQQGVVLRTEIDPTETYTVQADTGKIKEVVANLIDNSIKYTPKGSVTIALSKNEQGVKVTITDTGVGIPDEVIPKLFQKFSRADAQKANILGTGLGLYLAKIFVDAHHGTIGVTSEGKNKGSTFTVELPLTQPEKPATPSGA